MKLIVLILCLLPIAAPAQPARGDASWQGGTTLDLLLEMAASAPAASASSASRERGSEHRVIDKRVTGPARPQPTADQLALQESLGALAQRSIEPAEPPPQSDSADLDKPSPVVGEQPAARLIRADGNLQVALVPWVGDTLRYLRDNRSWVVAGALATLFLGWMLSFLGTRARRSDRRRDHAVTPLPDGKPAMGSMPRPVTRLVRRRRRLRRAA